MEKRTVLVTGCAGYIGSVLVGYLLRAGCRVIGVDNLMYDNGAALLPHLGDKCFEFHKRDVQDYYVVARLAAQADVVIPLAALVGAPACEKEQEYAFSVNHWAIAFMMEHLSKDQRVIYPNTNSGYGQTDGSKPCTEEDPLNPISLYGQTKCEGERVVLRHANSAVLRLATVFGASPRMRMDLLVNDFTGKICAASRKNPFVLFEPNFKRNFVHVRDVARAFLFLASRPHLKGVYNLGDPNANLTKLELAHKICDRLGIDTDVVQVGEGRDPDQRNYIVSNDKILNAGFSFQHSVQEGIDEARRVFVLFGVSGAARMRNV